jgi:hypothetical protein
LDFFFIFERFYKKVAFYPVYIVGFFKIDGVLKEGAGFVGLLLCVNFEISPQFDELAKLFEIWVADEVPLKNYSYLALKRSFQEVSSGILFPFLFIDYKLESINLIIRL